MSDQVLHPYKCTVKIIVLYILIFIFLGSKLEDKRFCTKWQQAFPDFSLLLISSWIEFWSLRVVSKYESPGKQCSVSRQVLGTILSTWLTAFVGQPRLTILFPDVSGLGLGRFWSAVGRHKSLQSCRTARVSVPITVSPNPRRLFRSDLQKEVTSIFSWICLYITYTDARQLQYNDTWLVSWHFKVLDVHAGTWPPERERSHVVNLGRMSFTWGRTPCLTHRPLLVVSPWNHLPVVLDLVNGCGAS